jgi:hypothetical protein
VHDELIKGEQKKKKKEWLKNMAEPVHYNFNDYTWIIMFCVLFLKTT